MSDGTADGSPPGDPGPVGPAADGAEPRPVTLDAVDEGAPAELDRESVPPAEAFGALGNEVRTAVVRALADADGPLPFSALLDASPVEGSAGFAYHLRQLTGHFLRKVDDAYELTAAGRRLARAIEAGTYTDRVSFEPVAVDDPCPHCGGDLLPGATDGDAAVACADCGRPVLRLPLPPGLDDRTPGEAVSALDRHHRRRLSSMADGVCPECGGRVDGAVAGVDDDAAVEGAVRATMRCRGCGASLAAPVTLTVLDHPAVVALYHRHGEDPADRPIWNVGAEWRETPVSRDPWLVRVSTTVGGEELSLFVDGQLSVVGTDGSAS